MIQKLLFTSLWAILLAFPSIHLNGQYYVGCHKDEIKLLMKENHKLLKLNTTNVNRSFNYLKYEDKINEITVLFFLSDNDVCTMVRMMYDYMNINDVEDFLKTQTRKIGENKYLYKFNKKWLLLEMDEGEWFFTVSVRENPN